MTRSTNSRQGWAVWALWLPGLLVALGAGIATAHGLYEVAVATKVPAPIAWLYPLITDGLALVAYISTARLSGSGRRYAWAVVVLAAGLSGLAQATYLAGGVAVAPPLLRFGVGAWPAIAAAIVAHLLFLLGTHTSADVQPSTADDTEPVQPDPVQPEPVQPEETTAPVQPPTPVQPDPPAPVQPPATHEPKQLPPGPEQRPTPPASPARDRARAAARRHVAHHGHLPTVSQLMELADVARGTAGTALKELREQPAQLHIVAQTDTARTQP
jgi:outer membrane biosynthesis protein TonB